jgi:hypothetical protein
MTVMAGSHAGSASKPINHTQDHHHTIMRKPRSTPSAAGICPTPLLLCSAGQRTLHFVTRLFFAYGKKSWRGCTAGGTCHSRTLPPPPKLKTHTPILIQPATPAVDSYQHKRHYCVLTDNTATKGRLALATH